MSIETPPETSAETQQKQLDHLDEMCHRIIGFIDEFEPVLRRFARFTGHPGGAVKAYLDARKGDTGGGGRHRRPAD